MNARRQAVEQQVAAGPAPAPSNNAAAGQYTTAGQHTTKGMTGFCILWAVLIALVLLIGVVLYYTNSQSMPIEHRSAAPAISEPMA